MTETGLLIAQGVVILLLYLLVWSIVRSSSRELRTEDEGFARPVETAVPGAAAPSAPEIDAPDAEPVPEVVMAAATPHDTASGSRREPTGPSLDLTTNLRPHFVVVRSPDLQMGGEIDLASGVTLGRGEQNGVSLPDAFVSHMHARVFRRGQYHYIEDLGSTNGTYVNDSRIDGEAQLRVRDEIRLGETVLRYEE